MKIFTSVCLVTSFLLCLLLVWLFGELKLARHSGHVPLRQLQEMQLTTSLIILTLIGAGVGSVIVVRTAREQYREEAMQNMQALIEETKKTQARSADE
jgi:hypothetical protein